MNKIILPIVIIIVVVGLIGAFELTQAGKVTQATVTIQNGMFNPSTLTVKAGTNVTWINKDSNATYMVTSNQTNLFMSSNLANGQSFSYQFNKTGTYPYYDMQDMNNMSNMSSMATPTGTITVQ